MENQKYQNSTFGQQFSLSLFGETKIQKRHLNFCLAKQNKPNSKALTRSKI